MITEPEPTDGAMTDAMACSWCGAATRSEGVCGQCGSPIQDRMPPLLVPG